jgi:hypothetical protein
MRSILPLLVLFAGLSAIQAADGAPTVLQIAGKPILAMRLPAGWTAVNGQEQSVILPPDRAPHIEVWPVKEAKIADAVAQAAELIVGKVTKFKIVSASDLTVAGAPAKQVIGTGAEADDGDPANAEATFFTVSGVVYVLVAHGEGDGAKEKHGLVAAILASVAAP